MALLELFTTYSTLYQRGWDFEPGLFNEMVIDAHITPLH